MTFIGENTHSNWVPQHAISKLCISLFWLMVVMCVDAAGPLSKETLSNVLKQDKKAFDALSDANEVAERNAQNLTDRRVRTLKQDLQDNVLAPEMRQHLQALLDSARKQLAAGNLANAQSDAVNFQQTLEQQVALFSAIAGYWRDYGRFDATVSTSQAEMMKANGIDVSDRREANSLRGALDRQIASGHFIEAMNETAPVLQTTSLRAAVSESAEIRARLENGTLTPVVEIPVEIPCKPASKSSGESVPVVGPSFDTGEEYHPGGRGGTVQVFGIISSEGCLKRAVVLVSSGINKLDVAALRLAQHGNYFPAEIDGARTEAGLWFKVTFANH